MENATIYWSGPLFSQSDRRWNRECTEYIGSSGYKIILPQDRAYSFFHNGIMDYAALAKDNFAKALSADIFIMNMDGSDCDSGASIEAGARILQDEMNEKNTIIGVRTDFRLAEDGKLNAMFRKIRHKIFFPFSENYIELCNLIISKIEIVIKEQ